MNVRKFSISRRAAAVVFAASAILSVQIATQSTSDANHRDSTGIGPYDRDSNDHYWNAFNLTEAGSIACRWGRDELGSRTVVNILEYPSGSGDLDVSCYDGDYNQPWFALTSCVDVISATMCNRYTIEFDLDYGQIDNNAERGYYQFAGCHEWAHTTAVGHQSAGSSCTVDGGGSRFLNTHDVEVINSGS